MSRLLKLLYDVADMRRQYQCVHDSVCGFSPRAYLLACLRNTPIDQTIRLPTLETLLTRLHETHRELDELASDECSIRRGHEIQDALTRYVEALTDSVGQLKALCELDLRDTENPTESNGDERRALRTRYDDAIQHHKRLGLVLNGLISGL